MVLEKGKGSGRYNLTVIRVSVSLLLSSMVSKGDKKGRGGEPGIKTKRRNLIDEFSASPDQT